ncbi:MAG: hypothetical protein ACI81L_002454 [Verrucomicrobiales bacterium]|jgi:hypothetical protein
MTASAFALAEVGAVFGFRMGGSGTRLTLLVATTMSREDHLDGAAWDNHLDGAA